MILWNQGISVKALAAKVESAGVKVTKTFESGVFHGLSVEAAEDSAHTLKQTFVDVSKAWPIGRIRLAPSEPLTRFSDAAAAANYSVHQWTGVDKAHAAGVFGKGVTVAIVDTGTDYTHPAVSRKSQLTRYDFIYLTDMWFYMTAWRRLRSGLHSGWRLRSGWEWW